MRKVCAAYKGAITGAIALFASWVIIKNSEFLMEGFVVAKLSIRCNANVIKFVINKFYLSIYIK